MKNCLILLFVLCINAAAAQTTDNWTLKKDNDEVKIYTADCKNSKIKAAAGSSVSLEPKWLSASR